MTIDEFKKTVLTQKDVITHQEKITGAQDECCGTNTSHTSNTDVFDGWTSIVMAIMGVNNTTTDNYGDWSDEGCC
jgi:hypothetical protein